MGTCFTYFKDNIITDGKVLSVTIDSIIIENIQKTHPNGSPINESYTKTETHPKQDFLRFINELWAEHRIKIISCPVVPITTAPAPSAEPAVPLPLPGESEAAAASAPAVVAPSDEAAPPAPPQQPPVETQPIQCMNIRWRIEKDPKRVVKHIRWFIQKKAVIPNINLKELETKVKDVLDKLNTGKIDLIYPDVSNTGTYDTFIGTCGGTYEIKVSVQEGKAIREKYQVNKMTGGGQEKMYVFRVDIPDENNQKVLLDVSSLDAEPFEQKKLKERLGSTSGRSIFGPGRVRDIKPPTAKNGRGRKQRTLKRNRKR
jgi:hypothetical protein